MVLVRPVLVAWGGGVVSAQDLVACSDWQI